MLTFLCFQASLLSCHKCWPETSPNHMAWPLYLRTMVQNFDYNKHVFLIARIFWMDFQLIFFLCHNHVLRSGLADWRSSFGGSVVLASAACMHPRWANPEVNKNGPAIIWILLIPSCGPWNLNTLKVATLVGFLAEVSMEDDAEVNKNLEGYKYGHACWHFFSFPFP